MKKIALLVGAAFALTAFGATEAEAQSWKWNKKRKKQIRRYNKRRPGRRYGKRRPGSKWGHLNKASKLIAAAKSALRRRKFKSYNLYLRKARMHLTAARLRFRPGRRPHRRPRRPRRPFPKHLKKRYRYRIHAKRRIAANGKMVRNYKPFSRPRRLGLRKQYTRYQVAAKKRLAKYPHSSLVLARRAYLVIRKALVSKRKWKFHLRKMKAKKLIITKKAKEAAVQAEKAGVKAEEEAAPEAAPEAAAPAGGEDKPAETETIGSESDEAPEADDAEAKQEEEKEKE